MSVFEDPPRRDKQLLIRLTAAEKLRLEDEAKRLDITAAELVRQAVNKFLRSKKRKKTKPKKKT
ncbi:MAG: hypothetical protein IH984_15010 [Planctomycetes bacterium]|nr:hypothetical protein [Planctomycetota bacterium]